MATAKLLYRRLDALFGSLKTRRPQSKLIESFVEDALGSLKDDLHLRAGLVYAERRDNFALVKTLAEAGAPVAEALDNAHSPIAELARHRVYIWSAAEAAGSPQQLGLLPRGPAAGLMVGQRPQRYAILFMLADGWQLEELDFALNTIRASLDARLVDARVRGSFREATEIQQSLLVEEPPAFAGYELAARSLPAEEVGGDFYDFYDLGESTLGLAIGDASGHGLPAALLVRDVVTGLRMGIEKELKVAHVFEKLNRVIHRSRLSSRFVSVFYAELERDGNLVYVNAGHQPPMLFFRDDVPGKLSEIELSNGGTVIGPLPEARFQRGFARLHPGEVLLLLTDGILERRDKAGEFFGVERVRAAVREHQAQPAETILAKLFDAALAWGDGRPWEDDATIVVVKRAS